MLAAFNRADEMFDVPDRLRCKRSRKRNRDSDSWQPSESAATQFGGTLATRLSWEESQLGEIDALLCVDEFCSSTLVKCRAKRSAKAMIVSVMFFSANSGTTLPSQR